MLNKLKIDNIALIDKIEVFFSEGMNVLSGETGAGKSIIVDSVNLVLGERADRELVRTGESSASVEAWFTDIPEDVGRILAEQQIEPGDDLVISRELSLSGKNVCRINGVLVTLTLLKSISDLLVDIHGQHEHQSLFNEKNHLIMLDSFDERTAGLKAEVSRAYRKYTDAVKSLRSLFGDVGDRERKIDVLKFQIDEIRQAKISQGEEEDLILQKKRLNSAEEIMDVLSAAYGSLYEAEPINVLSAIKDISGRLKSLCHVDRKYEKLASETDEAYYALDDIASNIRDDMDSCNFDPNALEEIEERLLLIGSLKRKYQDPCIDGEYIKKATQQLQDLIDSERLVSELTAKSEELESKLYQKSVELSELRREAAEAFQNKMMQQLSDLGMTSADFSVNFEDISDINDCSFTGNGIDTVEFFISTNKGEPPKPLRKVASGGEVSRIMLALKNIAADKGNIPTMIFDEIDTGISGRMAHVVAEKLHAISRNRQVVCVTHLPQIASMADRHFLVTKESGEKKTNTYILELDGEQRVDEIARLTGGESDVAKEHAREMIGRAIDYKTEF
jgi:DNA repair protein RecN (Recombination protein N)